MNSEDAARLYGAIREECDALCLRLCDRVKAQENTDRLNSDWQGVADQQREEIESLKRSLRVAKLEAAKAKEELGEARADVARLEQERSTLSAHLEAVAGEQQQKEVR